MLAYLMTEPELSPDGPLDESLDLGPDDDRLIAVLAYEAAPDSSHRCWIPARRRPNAGAALPIA